MATADKERGEDSSPWKRILIRAASSGVWEPATEKCEVTHSQCSRHIQEYNCMTFEIEHVLHPEGQMQPFGGNVQATWTKQCKK